MWVRVCRECGCTDADCSGCIERTGAPCWWVELDLCSAHPDPCPVGDPDCAGEVPGEWQCHDGCEPAPGPPPYEPPRVAPDRVGRQHAPHLTYRRGAGYSGGMRIEPDPSPTTVTLITVAVFAGLLLLGSIILLIVQQVTGIHHLTLLSNTWHAIAEVIRTAWSGSLRYLISLFQ